MAWVPLAATAASTLLSMQGQQQSAENQAAWANYNAAQTEADADAMQSAAIVEAGKIRKQAKAVRGEATAAMAGSGVDVNSGTAVQIDKNIVQGSEEDSWLAAFNGTANANRLRTQAHADRISAGQTMSANATNQQATLLSSAGSMYGGWKKYSGAKG